MLDNLNIHQSEALVRWIAQREGIAREALGTKGKSGILRSMESRAAFLHNPTHRVVFYYTPKHASWMNQVEIWLSILVRKLRVSRQFFPRMMTCATRSWRSLTTTIGRWPNPSSGRRQASFDLRHFCPADSKD